MGTWAGWRVMLRNSRSFSQLERIAVAFSWGGKTNYLAEPCCNTYRHTTSGFAVSQWGPGEPRCAKSDPYPPAWPDTELHRALLFLPTLKFPPVKVKIGSERASHLPTSPTVFVRPARHQRSIKKGPTFASLAAEERAHVRLEKHGRDAWEPPTAVNPATRARPPKRSSDPAAPPRPPARAARKQ